MRVLWALTIVSIAGGASGCKKGESSPPIATAETAKPISASAQEGISGCDHDLKSKAVLPHTWPYPAEARNVRWGNRYQKMALKFKPRNVAFRTATVTWKKGELIEVQDSEMVLLKPRRLVAKRDLFVKRKVWDQGLEVVREYKEVAKGEMANFLFYNSRGFCMIQTEKGPGWTPCTLGDTLEGLSAEHPFACEQAWWIKVRKSKVDQGWMVFQPELMDRVPASDAAK